MDELVSIGEFSARSGLSAKRLRSYASAGLLVPAAVDSASGYRYYSPGQIHEARVIERLRRAKIPVADIATFLKAPTVEQLERWEREVQNEARQRAQALAAARELVPLDETQNLKTEHPDKLGGTQMLALTAATATNTGQRPENEDAVFADELLAAVADGLGGHAAGEVASRIAIDVLRETFTGRSVGDLERAVQEANALVWEKANSTETLKGMGTTLCAVGAIEGSALAVVNVGDSRAYLLRDGDLTQLTVDHNVVSEMVARGELAGSEAAQHEYRYVLTRALGVGPTVEADATVLSPQSGDRLLLCTDGLVHELSDEEIKAVLVASDDPARSAHELVDRAVQAGATDNTSAIVIDIPR